MDYKIVKAIEVIMEAFTLSKSAVGIAFSGGKDSTVLWHLVKTYFPDATYHVIFGNTTVEFPESLKFARKLGEEWADGKVRFHEVLPKKLEEYKNNGQLSFLNIADDVDDVLDRRPCAFDRIGERIVKDSLTKSEYDSEIEGQMSFANFPEVMP